MSKAEIAVRGLLIVLLLAFGGGSSPCFWQKEDLGDIEHAVRIVRSRRGHFPATLEEVCRELPAYPWKVCGATDMWERPYWYWRTRDGFVLLSGGPDGLPWTSDDLVPYGDINICLSSRWMRLRDIRCQFAPCPCSGTARTLLILEYDVRAFRMARGRLPVDLTEMNMHVRGEPGLPGAWVEDAWRQPWHFSSGPDSYRLFSPGPDGISGTEDDVFPGVVSAGCMAVTGEPGTPGRSWEDWPEIVPKAEQQREKRDPDCGREESRWCALQAANVMPDPVSFGMLIPRKPPPGGGCSFVGR